MPALQKKHKKSSVHNIKSVMNTRYGFGGGTRTRVNRLMRPDWNHLQAPRYVWQGRLGIEPTTRGFGDRIASLRTFAPVLRIQLFAFATASERKTVVSPENREAIQLKKVLIRKSFLR